MTASPPEVSRKVLTVPSPKGTSVTTWFMRIEWAGGLTWSLYSSRMALAASIHSSDRNAYFSATGDPPCLLQGGGDRSRLDRAVKWDGSSVTARGGRDPRRAPRQP